MGGNARAMTRVVFRQSRVARCGGTERTVGMVTLRDMLGTAPQGRNA